MVGMSRSRAWPGNFSQFLTQLTDAGMQITDSSAAYDLVEGYVPINELPTIAELPQTWSGQIAITPIAYAARLVSRCRVQRGRNGDAGRYRAHRVQRRRNRRDGRRPVRRA